MSLFIRNLCRVITALFTLAVFASYLGAVNEACELLSHLRCPLFVLSIAWMLLLLFLKFRRLSICVGLLVLINAVPLLTMYVPRKTTNHGDRQRTLRVLQMNIWGGRNRSYQKVIDVIEKSDADVVGLSEITPTWAARLEPHLSQYPYRLVETGHGGIALYSRFALLEKELRFYKPAKRPRIYARLNFNNRNVTILFVHPVIPIGLYKLRNGDLSLIAEEAASAAEPVIVFGDLNCTPWSYYYDKLKQEGHLIDTMPGFGIQSSWNAFLPCPFIPIDHCLVSQEFDTVRRRVGPRVGSDHLPVFVELSISNLGDKTSK